MSATEGFAHPEFLIETDALERRLGEPGLRIFDCTKRVNLAGGLPDRQRENLRQHSASHGLRCVRVLDFPAHRTWHHEIDLSRLPEPEQTIDQAVTWAGAGRSDR
jgi:hypothetical protein